MKHYRKQRSDGRLVPSKMYLQGDYLPSKLLGKKKRLNSIIYLFAHIRVYIHQYVHTYIYILNAYETETKRPAGFQNVCQLAGFRVHTGLLNFLGWLLGENMCAFNLFERLVRAE